MKDHAPQTDSGVSAAHVPAGPQENAVGFPPGFDASAVLRLARFLERAPGDRFGLVVIEAGTTRDREVVLDWLKKLAAKRGWEVHCLDIRNLDNETILDAAARIAASFPAGILAVFGFEDMPCEDEGRASPFRALNLARDLLTERAPRIWCLLIHPESRMLLLEQAPDLCDFVSVWVEALKIKKEPLRTSLEPSPSPSPEPALLSRLPPLPLGSPELEDAWRALIEWRLDQARDRLAAFRIGHPEEARRLSAACAYLESQMLQHEGRWQEAAEALRRELSRRTEWDDWTALLSLSLAELEQKLAEPSASRRRLEKVRQWLDCRSHPVLEAEWNLAWGDQEYRNGDLDTARKYYETARRHYQSLGREADMAICLSRIADLLEVQGHFDEAFRIRRQEQLPTFERIGDIRNRVVTIGQIADILRARGRVTEALEIWRNEVLPVLERLGDIVGEAAFRWSMGRSLLQRSDYKEALKNLDRAFRLSLQQRRPDAIAVVGIDLARLLQAMGRGDAARDVYRQTLAAAEKIGWNPAVDFCRTQLQTLGAGAAATAR